MGRRGGAALIALVILANGCATLVAGTDQAIYVTSEPQGASVEFTPGGQHIVTPDVVVLDKEHSYHADLTLPCYQPASRTLRRRLSAWLLGNVLFGGLVGLVVDLVTDAGFTLRPAQLHTVLHPDGSCAAKLHAAHAASSWASLRLS